jgi:hypothetical protein
MRNHIIMKKTQSFAPALSLIIVLLASCSIEVPNDIETSLEQNPEDRQDSQLSPQQLSQEHDSEPKEEFTEKAKTRVGSSAKVAQRGNPPNQVYSSEEKTHEIVDDNPSRRPNRSDSETPIFLHRDALKGHSLAKTIFKPEPYRNFGSGGAILGKPLLKQDAPTAHAHPLTADVHDLALSSKKPSVHRIHPGQSFSIKGKEGTLVNFPAGSLAFKTGEPCQFPATIRMWEFYSLPDILLAGLSTDCDEGFLQTGGMIYLEAEANGRPLGIREGRRIKVNFNPSRSIDAEFDLFHGITENKRIAWRRAVDAKVTSKNVTAKGPVASVTIHDASKGGKSSAVRSEAKFLEPFFGFVFDLEKNQVAETVTDFSTPRSFVGLGTASFSNGTKLFFDGALQVRQFNRSKAASFQNYEKRVAEISPSSLILDFQGSFLAAKILPQHMESSFSLTLTENTRLNPTIRIQPSPDGCFFLINEHLSPIGSLLPEYKKVRFDKWEARVGDNHTVRCLRGKLGAYSTKHYLNLDARAGRHFGILSRSENPSVGTLHGKGLNEEEFAEQVLVNTSEKIERNIDGAEKVSQQALRSAQVDLARVMRPGRNGPLREVLDARLAKQLAPLGGALEMLRSSRELNDVLVAAAEQIERPETVTHCAALNERLENSIGEVEGWLSQNGGKDTEILIAKAAAASEFSSEFLSPSLGWHNLDKLKKGRNGMESFDLSSDFSMDPVTREDTEEPKTNTSFGPFFYAVWPKEGISSNAFIGQNNIPKGEFKAIGFAVGDDGQIFADFKDSRTGQKIDLDLKAMDRDLFRKTVAAWQ